MTCCTAVGRSCGAGGIMGLSSAACSSLLCGLEFRAAAGGRRRRRFRGFYSNGYGAPVLEVLTAPVAYHVVVLRRSFCGPRGCNEDRLVFDQGERELIRPSDGLWR
ncbi:hypothetical protein BHM03_00021704 [Ensete ventricosum]|nr:hypothetical protein BHM03_00021704 [Ensete ventricosum]